MVGLTSMKNYKSKYHHQFVKCLKVLKLEDNGAFFIEQTNEQKEMFLDALLDELESNSQVY